MTTVYLVRHGQASAGTDDYDRLSPLGQKQSLLLGEHWQRLDIKPEAAFAGTLKRQQQTAELALEAAGLDLKVKTLKDLNEYDHSQVDELFGMGMRSDGGDGLTIQNYIDIMARWRDADHQSVTDYESWQQFERRGLNAIHDVVKSSNASSLAFFSSGGIVATVLKQVLDTSFVDAINTIWYTRNSSVTTLKFNDEHVAMVDYNTVSHLHYHADHSLITQI